MGVAAGRDRLPIEIRPYAASDQAAVLELMSLTLGWGADPRFEALFRWKHLDNPWGASPAWVATHDGRVVGFRAFMRWRFRGPDGPVPAVRAVDTATHPDYQGQGLFTRLTLQGLDALRAEGVALVFNTPNDQSRPGYLKMGWREVGRLPVAVRPRRLGGAARLLRARVPADLWSQPTDAGIAATDVDPSRLADLLAAQPTGGELVTDRTVDYIRWRYGLPELGYRALVRPEGIVFFRLRRRGPAVEAAVGDTVTAAAHAAALARAAGHDSGASHTIVLGSRPAGFLPASRLGPILTRLDLGAPGPALALSLGDVELF